MTSGWLQLGVLVAIAARHDARPRRLPRRASSAAAPRPATGSSLPSSASIYRLCGVDPKREQRWTVYAFALLAFSVVSVLGLYAAPAPPGLACR